ncbi:DNA translocase FtsK [Oceanobacillus damuensis]|uniref:DNA translocase FtsK n=1 Tax=Oceanobacillus damuensis TaxID=937928 RepID=UPI0008334219|nr:DNA translocase FtsK [Oceanobacillus damuensis]
MWEQWKKKIKNIFTEEVEVEVEEVVEIEPQNHQTTGNQNLRAKMMYQYPDRNSFKFPVIPDEPERKRKTGDIPAYQKKQTNRTEGKPRKKAIDQVERNDSRETGMESRKIYKKNPDVPFQPTEVPSPVYGYQKKEQNREIENIPAYKRKELKQSEFGAIQPIKSIADNEIHKENEAGINRMEENAGDNQAANREEKTEAANDLELLSNKETAAAAETAKSKVISETHEKQPGERKQSSRKINPINSQENSRAFEKKEDGTKSEPFNVIMTPRDKKMLYDRQQERKRKEAAERMGNGKHFHHEATATTQDQAVSDERKQTENPAFEQQARHEKCMREQHRSQAERIRNEHKQSEGEKSSQPEQSLQVEAVQPVAEQKIHVPFHLLNDPIVKNNEDELWVNEQQELLEQTLKYFNVRAKVVKATQGPSVTRFEVQPEMGVKVSKIKNLSDDLKLNMSAKDIRIEAPIPGKNTVGIEIPNQKAEMVGLQGIFETDDFKDSKSPLSIALGLTIEGYPKITNIQKMPHGLIAGATGSGKSVCINTILISLIYKAHHEDVKFLLIDPKMVELAPYNGIPHLVAPVITDVKAATQSLKWAVNEMEDRYEKFVQEGVRDIERFNQKVIKQGRGNQKMPFIVIVIDELADLMMMSPQDVEDSISRIAQKARACGIHLLLATQRPSVDVITGLIKANIPTRIAFSVSSQIDSRTIVDASGAEKLLGRGDMLFVENGAGKSVRLQGPFVSDDEIERVTNYARSIAEPDYLFEQEQLLEQLSVDEDEDELMEDAIQFILSQNSASTSLLQRHFKIGYNRAARLIDSLESRGIISGQNGSKPRDVLITSPKPDEM